MSRSTYSYADPWEHPDGYESTAEMWIRSYNEMLEFLDFVLARELCDEQEPAVRRKRAEFAKRLSFWRSELERVRSAGNG